MITITQAANEYIQKMLSKDNASGLRLTVKKTGCSGFSYAPSVVATPNAGDLVLSMGAITLYIDPLWQHLLEGLTIDFVEENQVGLRQKKLIFINPKETSRCGCGESFHVE